MLDFLSASLGLMIPFGFASIAVLVFASNLAVKKLTGLASYFRCQGKVKMSYCLAK
jgi:hypothetical protein